MKSHRWRIAAVFFATILATGALTAGGATLAVGPGTMVAVSGGWKDPNCGTANQTYDVRLFRDTNYNGTMWRFCSGSWTNLCFVPHGSDSSDALLCTTTGYDGGTANDYPSSMKIVDIEGGASCRIEMRENANFTGGSYVQWDPIWVSSFVPWPNDVLSSIRRVC